MKPVCENIKFEMGKLREIVVWACFIVQVQTSGFLPYIFIFIFILFMYIFWWRGSFEIVSKTMRRVAKWQKIIKGKYYSKPEATFKQCCFLTQPFRHNWEGWWSIKKALHNQAIYFVRFSRSHRWLPLRPLFGSLAAILPFSLVLFFWLSL